MFLSPQTLEITPRGVGGGQTDSELNKITDDELRSKVIVYPDLISLKLNSSEITNEGLKHLKELKKLVLLDLSGCLKITDEGLQFLKELNEFAILKFKGLLFFYNQPISLIQEKQMISQLIAKGDYQLLQLFADTGYLSTMTFSDFTDDKGDRIIHKAVQQNQLKFVEFCVKIGDMAMQKLNLLMPECKLRELVKVDLQLDVKNKDQETPLMLSASLDYFDIVAYLLSTGFSTTAVNKQNQTAQDIAKEKGHTKSLERFTFKTLLDTIKMAHVAKVKSLLDTEKINIFDYFEREGALIFKALDGIGQDNSKKTMRTFITLRILSDAIESNNYEKVVMALKTGVNVNECFNSIESQFRPLHLAIQVGRSKKNFILCALLMYHGADLHMKKQNGEAVYAINDEERKDIQKCLDIVIKTEGSIVSIPDILLTATYC